MIYPRTTQTADLPGGSDLLYNHGICRNREEKKDESNCNKDIQQDTLQRWLCEVDDTFRCRHRIHPHDMSFYVHPLEADLVAERVFGG